VSDALGIPAGAIRAVWVFAIDLPEGELDAFRQESHTEGGDVLWPLRDALGVTRLDHGQVEVFDIATIRDYGLARYLTEANGMDAASVAPDAARLDALTGAVALVFSAALPEDVARLDPRPPLRLIGRYAERLDFTPRTAPASATARSGQALPADPPEPKRPSDGAMMGRVALGALLVLFALVALMIWIAG